MLNYKEMYFKLFAATADAVVAIEDMNFGLAQDILIKAQLEAEEKHMEDTSVSKTCNFLEKL